ARCVSGAAEPLVEYLSRPPQIPAASPSGKGPLSSARRHSLSARGDTRHGGHQCQAAVALDPEAVDFALGSFADVKEAAAPGQRLIDRKASRAGIGRHFVEQRQEALS